MRALLLLTVTIAAPVLAKRDPEFGSTVLIDERMQIVDLHPHHAGRIMEGASGHRSSEAILRYEEGRLKPLLKTNARPMSAARRCG